MRYTPEHITYLDYDEVFVFGSNAEGFHGAGAAGFALRWKHNCHYKNDPWFQHAKRTPIGSPHRVGKWAVLGVAKGYQEGRDGNSYAIKTVEKAGKKRSTPLSEIKSQLFELIEFAEGRPSQTFLVTKIGCKLAGYKVDEIRDIFFEVQSEADPGFPENVALPREFDNR